MLPNSFVIMSYTFTIIGFSVDSAILNKLPEDGLKSFARNVGQ